MVVGEASTQFLAMNHVGEAPYVLDRLYRIDLLRRSDPEYPCDAAKDHADANRYTNVVPYDSAILPGPYINASLIPPLPDAERGFPCIASQAPLPDTYPTFFEHICTQKPRVLLNLTPLEEQGIPKSDRYWPLDTASPLLAGPWSVSLLSIENASDAFPGTKATALDKLRVRRLQLSRPGMSHNVTQLHFVGWPDHGDLDVQSFAGLLEAVHAVQDGATTPAWIHCSAGIGRSGTVIGALLAQMQPSSFFAQRTALEQATYLTAYMRKFRPGSVQTPTQLISMAAAIAALC